MEAQYTELLKALNEATAALQVEINTVVERPTNKAACRRVRTSTLALEKIAKDFRKVSLKAL